MSYPVKEYKERRMRGRRKIFQANGRALVKTERTVKEPSRAARAAQYGWNTRCEW